MMGISTRSALSVGALITLAACQSNGSPKGTGGTHTTTASTTGATGAAGGMGGATDATSTSTFMQMMALCGNGSLDPGEQCDDGNTVSGDGCSASCTIEPFYTCPTPGKACKSSIVCGDGKLQEHRAMR